MVAERGLLSSVGRKADGNQSFLSMLMVGSIPEYAHGSSMRMLMVASFPECAHESSMRTRAHGAFMSTLWK